MKTKFVMTFAFLFGICAMVKSQSAGSGLFETSQDFIDQKMIYSGESTTIEINEFSDKDYITVVQNNHSHYLKKKDVFGYTDRNNITYRFVGNSLYLILNPSEETLLYQHESLSAKNQGKVMHYYFSSGALGEVQELTLKNVKNTFPNDLAFHEALDAEFRSDEELASYELLPVLAAILPVSKENQIWVSNPSNEVDGL